VLDDISARQCGALTRRQALECGLTDEAIEARLRDRWQRVLGSIYVTHNGPLSRDCLLWAAALRAGDGAVLSHQSAAEVAGLVDEPQSPIHVTVPTERRVRRISGIVVHRSSRVDAARHPIRLPPQTLIEETMVDLTQSSRSLEQALGWITRGCGRRLVRPDRIASAIDARKKVRWRGELLAAVNDVAEGVHSPLELRYLRDVERAHGLPRGSRQHAVGRVGGRFYDDVRYVEFGVVVELDGRSAHPDEARWRDMRRDNLSVASGARVLRYGWADVTGQPCEVAAQVATVLRAAGWRGPGRRCRPACPAPMITETSPCSDTEKFP
jgi:very-short-patch-repair endonuclease